ncbi:hypothetical protein SH668x_000453 [Planctomicrobium sp. SH668]|uniref:hypothetical protein n=1 Tax=Planctomicrobium sp. SH668 TaxID=3448126 RepID=UPI003F5BFB2C
MSSIKVQCPDCSVQLKVKETAKRGKCPKCGSTIDVQRDAIVEEVDVLPEDDWDTPAQAPQAPSRRQSRSAAPPVSPGKVSKTKKKGKGWPLAEDSSQFHWGLTLFLGGILASYLPRIGFTLKIFQKLPPSAQIGIGYIATVAGLIMLGLFFLKKEKPETSFRNTWGPMIATFLVLVITSFNAKPMGGNQFAAANQQAPPPAQNNAPLLPSHRAANNASTLGSNTSHSSPFGNNDHIRGGNSFGNTGSLPHAGSSQSRDFNSSMSNPPSIGNQQVGGQTSPSPFGQGGQANFGPSPSNFGSSPPNIAGSPPISTNPSLTPPPAETPPTGTAPVPTVADFAAAFGFSSPASGMPPANAPSGKTDLMDVLKTAKPTAIGKKWDYPEEECLSIIFPRQSIADVHLKSSLARNVTFAKSTRILETELGLCLQVAPVKDFEESIEKLSYIDFEQVNADARVAIAKVPNPNPTGEEKQAQIAREMEAHSNATTESHKRNHANAMEKAGANASTTSLEELRERQKKRKAEFEESRRKIQEEVEKMRANRNSGTTP